jgi:hypothetical protein
MTDKTSTQNLTRTQDTDDPKKMDVYLGALARESDQRMTAQLHHLGRSQKPPAAMVEIRTPVIVAPGGPGTLVFDTVAFDTAGMVDLSADARSITWNESGYWAVGAYVRCSGFSGASPGAVGLWLESGGSGTITAFHDGLFGSVGCSWSTTEDTTTPPESAALGITNLGTYSGSPVATVFYAAMWVYKIRDL